MFKFLHVKGQNHLIFGACGELNPGGSHATLRVPIRTKNQEPVIRQIKNSIKQKAWSSSDYVFVRLWRTEISLICNSKHFMYPILQNLEKEKKIRNRPKQKENEKYFHALHAAYRFLFPEYPSWIVLLSLIVKRFKNSETIIFKKRKNVLFWNLHEFCLCYHYV